MRGNIIPTAKSSLERLLSRRSVDNSLDLKPYSRFPQQPSSGISTRLNLNLNISAVLPKPQYPLKTEAIWRRSMHRTRPFRSGGPKQSQNTGLKTAGNINVRDELDLSQLAIPAKPLFLISTKNTRQINQKCSLGNRSQEGTCRANLVDNSTFGRPTETQKRQESAMWTDWLWRPALRADSVDLLARAAYLEPPTAFSTNRFFLAKEFGPRPRKFTGSMSRVHHVRTKKPNSLSFPKNKTTSNIKTMLIS
jgi:hypothetical protein